tara:strand:- start:1605 stop:2462 length:858 start_codon:yes stop_codon:yes gene_type:complete
MKVVVIGGNGQLGNDLCKVYKKTGSMVQELNHDDIEISDFNKCCETIKRIESDLIINTAAMHQVESCEKYPQKAFLVNGLGARNLAIVCEELDLPLVHFSTDYVFDGSKGSPYVESDVPIPLNVYGNTKLSGENFIRKLTEKYFIIRVSGLYGHSACRAKGGLNFVKLMLKLAENRNEIRVVNDEILSPTFTYDIAVQLEKLTRTKEYGLYHMTSKGSCSWYEFAGKIFHLTNAKVKLSIALPEEFPSKVPRPKYSVLENANLVAKGMDTMPHWSESLTHYLQDI